MKKQKTIALTILLAAFTLLSAANIAEAQTYEHVTTITGANDQTTNYFTIPSGEWKITYTISLDEDYPEYGSLSAHVYPKGEVAGYITSFDADQEQTTGTIYVHQGNSQYYLKILAANLKGYTINIESEVTSPLPSVPEFSTLWFLFVLAAAASLATVILVKKRQTSP